MDMKTLATSAIAFALGVLLTSVAYGLSSNSSRLGATIMDAPGYTEDHESCEEALSDRLVQLRVRGADADTIARAEEELARCESGHGSAADVKFQERPADKAPAEVGADECAAHAATIQDLINQWVNGDRRFRAQVRNDLDLEMQVAARKGC